MAVLGGGIVGISTALLLKRSGMTVAVIEATSVGSGVTGHTTAKLSSLHGLTYHSLSSSFGEDGARVYGELNEAGIHQVAGWIEEEAIDCDFRRKPNFTYALDDEDLSKVEKEVEAAQRAGLPASFTAETDLPFPVAGAVRFEEQADFHPRRFLLALAALIPGEGSHVFEGTRAIAVDDGKPSRVQTTGPAISAGHVVVATHLPFLDRGLYFARTHPERSYAIGVRMAGEHPQGMYLSTESPAHSIRSHSLAHEDLHGELLIVGGESHKTGQGGDTSARYDRLEEFARTWWDVESVDYRWSSQDNMPVDGAPYIGKLTPLSRRLYTATGFKKWGLAAGVGSAMLLHDLITGRPNAWAEVFDPARVKVKAAPELIKENANAAKRFVADRLTNRASRRAEDLEPGEGGIVDLDGKRTAGYRDDEGALHAVSPMCTHLYCLVNWNSAERSWDCPCHGSRFDIDGEVLHGPAVEPLERRP